MTRLWILSDLHLEAVRHPEAFRPARPAFDVLVVAGDIDRGMRTVAGLADGKPAVFVLGNHEFWNHQVDRQRRSARRAADRHKVLLLDDAAVEVSGVRFVGGTLWGDGQLAGRHATPNLPTNERIVSGEGREAHPITSQDQTELHRITRSVIEAAVAAPGPQPLVVVTHHAPHPSCLPVADREGWAAGHSASDRQWPGRSVGAWPHPRHNRSGSTGWHPHRLEYSRTRVHQPEVQGRVGRGDPSMTSATDLVQELPTQASPTTVDACFIGRFTSARRSAWI